jgi:hypothetical protein
MLSFPEQPCDLLECPARWPLGNRVEGVSSPLIRPTAAVPSSKLSALQEPLSFYIRLSRLLIDVNIFWRKFLIGIYTIRIKFDDVRYLHLLNARYINMISTITLNILFFESNILLWTCLYSRACSTNGWEEESM